MVKLKQHENLVRKIDSVKTKKKYISFKNFKSAKKSKDLYLIMEGDWGGQIYLTAPVKMIKCSEKDLLSLLKYIDNLYWNEPEGAKIYFERRTKGEFISGGMGGGLILDELWVHEKLTHLKNKVEEILTGNAKIGVKKKRSLDNG